MITPDVLLYAKLPSPPESVTETFPRIVESVIPNCPALYVVFVPAEKCACTSAALGPVYVKTPVVLLYAKLPSPPVSVTLRVASTHSSAV